MGTAIERYSELFKLQGRNFTVFDGSLYICENHTVRQFASTKEQKMLGESQVSALLRELKGYIFIGQSIITTSAEPDWYAVVCEQGFNVDEYPSAKTRSEIKRSLRRCNVRKVSGQEIVDQAFDVMTDAMKGQFYSRKEMEGKKRYQEQFLLLDNFQDIIDIWGVFSDEELVGVAQNYKTGQLEVNYSSIKFKPQFLSHCSSYGLIHTMNEFYLKQRNAVLVNDGYRNVYHKTTIQQVLQKHFHFYKLPMRLQLHFRQPVRFLVDSLRPFRQSIGSLTPKAEALFLLDEIEKGYSTNE